MKRKIVLPLLAVLLGVVAAFASVKTDPQIAWFKPVSGVADDGAIDDPVGVTEDNPCTTASGVQCKINGRNAYDTEQHANNAPNSLGLLKYSD
jgi:hypothetical protein